LIRHAVDLDIACLRERHVVFRPLLTEVLGDHLLEHLTAIVLAVRALLIEVLGRAKRLCARHKEAALVIGGAEAKREPATAACVIQFAHERHDLGGGGSHVDDALVVEAPDVVVGERRAVVTVNHGLEESGVGHRSEPLSFILTTV